MQTSPSKNYSRAKEHLPLWREIQKRNFTNWKKLCDFLELSLENRSFVLRSSHFPLNLPMRLAQKIEKNSLTDPLFKQFVPIKKETLEANGFSPDPLQEKAFQKEKKLLQKYAGRALLLASSGCAMHCRYCFRQNFPYEREEKGFEEELEAIKQDSSLFEIILSGGDPLSLPNHSLQSLLKRICEIPHIKQIRFHTRFPIGIPERIDLSFLEMLKKIPLQIWFMIHANHPKEMDSDVLFSLKQIQKLGIPVLQQGVLLKEVNDDLLTLKEMYRKLTENGITPYYLYQLDQVKGTAHFPVSEAKGLSLIDKLLQELPGYAVPKFVKEVPGEKCKRAVS